MIPVLVSSTLFDILDGIASILSRPSPAFEYLPLSLISSFPVPCGVLIDTRVQPQGILINDKRKVQFNMPRRHPAAGAAQ